VVDTDTDTDIGLDISGFPIVREKFFSIDEKMMFCSRSLDISVHMHIYPTSIN